MQDQALSVTLPSTRQGSRTTPVGPVRTGPPMKIQLEGISQKGPVFAAGNFSTTEFLEGPVPMFGSHHAPESGPISDFEVIRSADLGPTRTMVAQVLWSLRGFLSATLASTMPFQEWGIEEIVSAARGSSR